MDLAHFFLAILELQVPIGSEDQFLEQYLNPSNRENFIEHMLPWLPETDRFDTSSFREGEDCVKFAMKLGADKKDIFSKIVLFVFRKSAQYVMILKTYHDNSWQIFTLHVHRTPPK